MIGVISNPVKSLNSHNGGWTYVCKNILESKFKNKVDILTQKDNWDDYDMLIINEGVNSKPETYNFFGGVSENTKEKLEMLATYTGELYSINFKIDYNHMVSKRKELIDFRDINFRSPNVIYLDECTDKLVLGDSHSLSAYREGHSISRNDGRTLNTFLREGIGSYINSNINELVFYAGNIDVRFHMHRLKVDVFAMCCELVHQLKGLNLNKVSVVALLPVESEDRKIPGTGKYKGQNFFGTREERLAYVLEFNKTMKHFASCNHGIEFLEWDLDYDQELSFDHMESRQSVHLRPKSYMFKNFIEC